MAIGAKHRGFRETLFRSACELRSWVGDVRSSLEKPTKWLQKPKNSRTICVTNGFAQWLAKGYSVTHRCNWELIFGLGAYPIFSVLELDWNAMGTLC